MAAAKDAQLPDSSATGSASARDALPSLVDYWKLDQAAFSSPQVCLHQGTDVLHSNLIFCFSFIAETAVVQVLETSQRLLQLQQLLGEQDDIDIVWMLTREPGYVAQPLLSTLCLQL